MGNSVVKASRWRCLCPAGEISQQHDAPIISSSDPLNEGEVQSFKYESETTPSSFYKVPSSEDQPKTTLQYSISGASVSANPFTNPSTFLRDLLPSSPGCGRSRRFESTESFAPKPLQPVPRKSESEKEPKRYSLMRILRRAISTVVTREQRSSLGPVKGGVSGKEPDSEEVTGGNGSHGTTSDTIPSGHVSMSKEDEGSGDSSMGNQNLQWAQGKAGEDRVHVVVSEEHGWVFVGIYDGFNGPDAPEYLLSNLYSAVHKELRGLLWNDKFEIEMEEPDVKESNLDLDSGSLTENDRSRMSNRTVNGVGEENYALENGDIDANSKRKQNNGIENKIKETQKRCCEWDRERPELDRKENLKRTVSNGVAAGVKPSDVLKALSEALKKTEDAFLDMADKMVRENPELALMGSCVLVMLMKEDDVYLMNVGDSRAVLAREAEPYIRRNLDRINEEPSSNADESKYLNNLTALQLTMDHSTCVKEEVQRIKNEHPDDASAVKNERLKGYLKVTRAFGAGFLKQPKWNDALLEMFRLSYVGTAPYLNCIPSLYHHKLSRRDRVLILSSDGLYQYFSNEGAVAEVELYISAFPDGDPAQHLIEEVLFRAAKKAGMAIQELLDIPQGERRRYHDDVSIIVISLEGTIWRSSV